MRDRERIEAKHSVPINVHYKKDVQYVIKISRWILRSLGLWPIVHGPEKILSKLIFVMGMFLLYFASLPSFVYMALEMENMLMRMKLFGTLFFAVTSSWKYCTLAYRKPYIRECVELLTEDWKMVKYPEDRNIMLKYGRISRNVTIISATFMYNAGLFYFTFLQFFNAMKSKHEQNFTTRILLFPPYSGFINAQESPVYELLYFVHSMCGYVIYSVTTGTCGLAALFATHACGQTEIVMSRINDLMDGKTTDQQSNVALRFKAIVQHHMRILEFSSVTEKLLREVCLLEFFGSTVLICLLEYFCIADWEEQNTAFLVSYLIFLCSFTFNVFIFCYIGELLMQKTGSVGITCFMSNWYQLPITTSRGLILIIAISSKPVRISAGRMFDLSISNFANILKTSLAYFSFLRTAIIK